MKARIMLMFALLLLWATAAQAQPGPGEPTSDPNTNPFTTTLTDEQRKANEEAAKRVKLALKKDVRSLSEDLKSLRFYRRVTPHLCQESCLAEFWFHPEIQWIAPPAASSYDLDYRVSWSVGRNWRGLGKSNTARRGNMIVKAGDDSINNVRLPAVKMKPGETLYIRARLCCGVKGPWGELTMTAPAS